MSPLSVQGKYLISFIYHNSVPYSTVFEELHSSHILIHTLNNVNVTCPPPPPPLSRRCRRVARAAPSLLSEQLTLIRPGQVRGEQLAARHTHQGRGVLLPRPPLTTGNLGGFAIAPPPLTTTSPVLLNSLSALHVPPTTWLVCYHSPSGTFFYHC